MDTPASNEKKYKKPKDRSVPRIYDSEGFKRRVDCILYRDKSLKEVLLVSSRGSEGCWTIPGGGIELNETSATAAIRESHEEAGVYSEVIENIGIFEDEKRKTRTEVFRLLVTKEDYKWRDNDEWGRMRKWFTVQETIDILNERGKFDKLEYFPSSCTTNTSKTTPTLLKLDTPTCIGTNPINGTLFLERNLLSTVDS